MVEPIETEEIIEEPVVEEEAVEVEEEEKPEINSSGDEEEDKTGIMKKIMDKVFKGKAPVEEEETKEESDISEKFTTAALALDWTEAEIKTFAEGYDNEALEEMIPFLTAEEPAQEEAPAKEDEKKPLEEKPSGKESDEMKVLKQRLADLEKSLGAVKDDKAAKERVDLGRRVDEIFDRAGEKFKVFGLTAELPRFPAGPRKGQVIPTSPAYKARSDVYGIAAKLITSGSDVSQAMQDALDWYKGRNLEKDVKRDLIKGLKRNEKKLSAKRMGKETTKTFSSEEERQAEVVREAARKKGIELD